MRPDFNKPAHSFKGVTFAFPSDFGIGFARGFCKELKIAYAPYAQYPRATFLAFLPPRARKWRSAVLFSDQMLVILNGDKTKEVHALTYGPLEEGSTPGIKTQRASFSSFNKGWNEMLLEFAKEHDAVFIQDSKGEEIK